MYRPKQAETMHEKLASLHRAVEFGLCNGKTNMVVDLQCLAELFDVRRALALELVGVQAERAEFRRCCELALASLEDATGFSNGVRSEGGVEEAECFAARIKERIRNALDGTA